MATKESPITLITEEVTYLTMTEREKQIYDVAYKRGAEDMVDVKVRAKQSTFFIAGVMFSFFVAVILLGYHQII